MSRRNGAKHGSKEISLGSLDRKPSEKGGRGRDDLSQVWEDEKTHFISLLASSRALKVNEIPFESGIDFKSCLYFEYSICVRVSVRVLSD